MPTTILQHYASSLASHRLLLYSIFSTGAVSAVILNALNKYSNFYSVAVYLSRSNGSAIVLANFGVLLALLCGRVLQQIFFGPLRTMEVERLYDRVWFFLTESLLAFTIFRDEFGISFALMFGVLLFAKCFHWLLSDRIEWMDQRPYPGPPILFHVRVNALMAILWLSDFCIFLFLIDSMVQDGVGSTVLFASEYAILMASVLNSIAKYSISVIDLRRASQRGGENAPPWEDKSMYVFYVELATDFLKLVTYLTFFMLVLKVYGLPLNIIRDVYITARSFIMKVRDLMRYRTATRNMDERYPNAMAEEMAAMGDRTCIICREEMEVPALARGDAGEQNGNGETQANAAAAPSSDGPNTTPKKLVCGHIFHFYCLRSWLERQQSCPTCRRSVLEPTAPGAGTGTARQGQAPAPQPGAVPQNPGINGGQAGAVPPLPGQGQGQQQQQPQVPNFGGLFGRLMGVAGAAPPIVPGQFVNPPNVNGNGQLGHGQQQQQQAPGGTGPAQHQRNENVMLGANGWPIVQGIPYDYAYGQPPNPNVLHQQHQQHQQPQYFQGFYGPGGVWQPWPFADGDVPIEIEFQNDVEELGPGLENAERTLPPPSGMDLREVEARDNNTQPEAVQSESQSISENREDSDEDIAASTSTPRSAREAAALAALRRSSGHTSPKQSQSLAPISSANENRGESSASKTQATSQSGAQVEGTSSISGMRTGAGSSSSAGKDKEKLKVQGQALPRLIPLFVPSNANQRINQGSSLFGQQQQQRDVRVPRGSTSTSRRFTPSSLPISLSDEQLGRLDRLTRDAIDERLRVLEEVQRVSSRCVEELLRVRSVLPRSSPNTISAGDSGNGSVQGNASESDSAVSPSRSSPIDGEGVIVSDVEDLRRTEDITTGSS